MNRIFKTSLMTGIIVTALYVVLFYPLVLINIFELKDLMLVALSICPGIFIMAVIYNLDEYDKEPLWLLAIAFIFGAINLHLDVDLLEYFLQFIPPENQPVPINSSYRRPNSIDMSFHHVKVVYR